MIDTPPPTQTPEPLSPDDIASLVAAQKAECNEYVNGTCRTRGCFRRGGWRDGPTSGFTPMCQAKQILRALADRARLAAQVETLEQELDGIDALMARRPALDQPTRLENIAKALVFAARTDEAERRYEAQTRVVESLRRDYERWHQMAQGLGVKCFEAERQLAALTEGRQEQEP